MMLETGKRYTLWIVSDDDDFNFVRSQLRAAGMPDAEGTWPQIDSEDERTFAKISATWWPKRIALFEGTWLGPFASEVRLPTWFVLTRTEIESHAPIAIAAGGAALAGALFLLWKLR